MNPSPTAQPGKLERNLRRPEVESLVGLGKSSLYEGIKNGTFPAPVRLSARAVGWRESDIATWQAKRQHTKGQ